MKKIITFLVVMMMVVAFVACDEETPATEQSAETAKMEEKVPDEEKTSIIGSWEYDGSVDCAYIFNKDGTGAYEYYDKVMDFEYTDKGDVVEISYEGETNPNVFKYTVDGDKLMIEDSFGDTVTYVKK